MTAATQPRFGEDAFPIGRLILDRAKTLGLSRTELVQRLGYRNIAKGHRVLRELLMTGKVPPVAARNLAGALEIDQEIVDSAILASVQQQHDRARAHVVAQDEAYRTAFRPHLQVQTERRIPSPIFVAAIIGVGKLRIVSLPDEAFAADQNMSDETVKRVIQEHYRTQGGHVPTFGAIRGYILVLVPGYEGMDFGLPFDVKGDPAGDMIPVGRLPVATLGLKPGNDQLARVLSTM